MPTRPVPAPRFAATLRCLLLTLATWALAARLPPGAAIDLGAGHVLVPRQTFTDAQGQTHTRLTHYYRGLRVWGSELVSHGLAREGGAELRALAGLEPASALAPTPSPALPMLDAARPLALPLDLDLTPSVPLAAAQQSIRAEFGAAAATLSFPAVEPVIFPRMLTLPTAPLALGTDGRLQADATRLAPVLAGYALAYQIQAEAQTGDPLRDSWDYLVDAHSGKVLLRVQRNQGLVSSAAQPSAETPAALAPAPQAAALTAATGIGNSLYSGLVSLNTASSGSGFLLVDTTRGQGGVFPGNPDLGGNAVTDLEHTAGRGPGMIYSNSSNTWGTGAAPAMLVATQTPAGQTIAVDAAYAMQAVWDYYRKVHGRNGIDDQGTQTLTRVNYGGLSGQTDNAFWQPGTFAMTVQDGNKYWPPANLQTMGHEFTHGVTEFSANLAYTKYESGGLNEGTSDIFGAMVATYTDFGSGTRIGDTGTNWFYNFNLASTGAPFIYRYMYKPSLNGAGYDAWQPILNTGIVDPHNSSGPLNRAFFFLSQGASASPASPYYSAYLPAGMTGIGNDEAAQLWYRALTVYLTPTSRYRDARTAALRAAYDLFPPSAGGAPSPEILAVRQAFGAVNVGNPDATSDDLGTPSISAAAAPSGTVTPSGSNLALTALPADPFGISEVDYFVDQILVAPVFSAPWAVPQFDAAHLLANGAHQLIASAFSPAGNQGTSLPQNFTLANPVQQLLTDPGLEGGGSAWQGDTDLVVQTDFSGATAHGGYRYASFDRDAGRQNLALSQQVAIPAGVAAILSLWTRIQGNPALGPVDSLQLQVQPGAGAPVTLDTFSNTQARADWVKRSYDLSAYQGQAVTVSFGSSINPGTGTVFLLDDITLCSSAAVPQVQVAVSLNPSSFPPGPLTVDLFPGATAGPFFAQVTGTGNPAVTWSILEGAAGGALSSGSSYRAPVQPGFYHVLATSVADPNVTAQVSIQVRPPVSITPASATVNPGSSLPLTVLAAPGVSVLARLQEGAVGGTLANTGPGQLLYTAPATAGTYHVLAQDARNAANQAIATLTVPVLTQVSVAPATMVMAVGSTMTFTATVAGPSNTSLIWAVQEGAAGGSLSIPGDDGPVLYTAPALPGTYHLLATSAADPTQVGSATVTVVNGLAINPPQVGLLTGVTFAFQATAPGNPAIVWSLPAGPGAGGIDALGVYTAPGAPGSYTIQASAGSLAGSAQALVKTTNLSGSGPVQMNADDLAILADAWGGPGVPALDPAADLNSDGVVDDQDVALFFSRFGGLP